MPVEVLHLLALQKQNRNKTCISYKKKRQRVGSSAIPANIRHPTLLTPASVDLTCMNAQRIENTHTQPTTMPMHMMYKNANKSVRKHSVKSFYHYTLLSNA